MRRWIFLLVIASLLIQSAVKTVLLIEWKIYQKEITELYCINKDKPEMQCNGQCHLAQQMRRIEADYEHSKSPFVPKHVKSVDFLLFCQPDQPLVSVGAAFSENTPKGGHYLHLVPQISSEDCFHPPRFVA